VFAQQVEHGGFNGGDHVDGGAQVKGLQATARGVAVSKGAAHLVEDIFVGAEGFADNQRRRVFQSLADFFAGDSPTPVLPALSVMITMLRVKNGACAPLRFISMLSCPATGITLTDVTTGVEDWPDIIPPADRW
jgi:hypothetical protein